MSRLPAHVQFQDEIRATQRSPLRSQWLLMALGVAAGLGGYVLAVIGGLIR